MKFLVIDSSATEESGIGSPAFFAQPIIRQLRERGHEVFVRKTFDPGEALSADLVWSEWCNDEALAAAASGTCPRLVLRIRNYEAFLPLDRIAWGNVAAIVYGSVHLREAVWERHPVLREKRSLICPTGVELDKIPFRERKPGNVIALVSRLDPLKGYQLALEWAQTRPDIELHVTTPFSDRQPKLREYLDHARSKNFIIHGNVDTIPWLDDIDASFLLSCSVFETFGRAITEAMAMGIKPLIHDYPSARFDWPVDLLWRSLNELDGLLSRSRFGRTAREGPDYTPRAYRRYVSDRLEAEMHAEGFVELVEEIGRQPPLLVRPHHTLFESAGESIKSGSIDDAVARTVTYRACSPRHGAHWEENGALAVTLAARYYNEGRDADAETWALRALNDGLRVEALCLLGEIAVGREDYEDALRWYEAACVMETTTRYTWYDNERFRRRDELRDLLRPRLELGSPPANYIFIVPVRNAVKWIGDCLKSIDEQSKRNFRCVVVDDGSTDGTVAAIGAFVGLRPQWRLVESGASIHCALGSTVLGIQASGTDPDDVIVVVDGDDKLASTVVLSRLDEAYAAGAWLTYGSSVNVSDGRKRGFHAYPKKIVDRGDFRQHRMMATHLKTFRRFLFDCVKQEDLQENGIWWTASGDFAFMLPMLEMAAERAVFIPDVLYVYNDLNPASIFATRSDAQVENGQRIRARSPYVRLTR